MAVKNQVILFCGLNCDLFQSLQHALILNWVCIAWHHQQITGFRYSELMTVGRTNAKDHLKPIV